MPFTGVILYRSPEEGRCRVPLQGVELKVRGWDSNSPQLLCLAARTQDDCHLAYSSRRSGELTAIFFASLTQNV